MVNNELVTRLALALISAGVGAAIAWYVAKEKYHREAVEQVQEVKDYYKERAAIDILDSDDVEVEGDDPEVEVEEAEEEEVFPDSEEYKKNLEVYGRSNIAADHPDDMPQTPYNKKFTRPSGDPIYLIPREVFYSDEDNFEKETLTWYAGDDVMVDFYEEVMTDYQGTVGDSFQDAFVKNGPTRDAWVRNERLQVDYEITLHEGDYTEIVLGFTPEKEKILKFRDDD